MEVKPGYKKTEIGVIPDDWEMIKMGRLTNSISSGKSKQRKPNGNFHFYGSTGIIGFCDIPDYNGERILVARVGANAGSLYTVKGRYSVSDNTLIIDLNDCRLTSYIANYLLNKNLNRIIFGSGQPLITGSQLKDVQVAMPTHREEVKSIVEAISSADSLITSLEKLIEKKKLIKQGVMQELLTGKRRLPGFSGEWEIKNLGKLVSSKLISLGRGSVISKKAIDTNIGYYPIYSSSIHNNGLFGCYDDYMFDEELITWSVDGGGNFFHRKKHRFSVTNVCGYMRVDQSRICYGFLYYQLSMAHKSLKFDYTIKAHPSVIKKLYTITLPTLNEQSAIFKVLSEFDESINSLKTMLNKYKLLKQAMMQELLTGRIRLI